MQGMDWKLIKEFKENSFRRGKESSRLKITQKKGNLSSTDKEISKPNNCGFTTQIEVNHEERENKMENLPLPIL